MTDIHWKLGGKADSALISTVFTGKYSSKLFEMELVAACSDPATDVVACFCRVDHWNFETNGWENGFLLYQKIHFQICLAPYPHWVWCERLTVSQELKS